MPAVLGLVHEIPVTAQPGMLVPARVYADDELWEQIGGDRSLAQLKNVATLPGVTGAVYGMPDMHEGYGFPVGGVAAMRLSDGVISPGGVGYDINCGVRLLASGLRAERIRAKLPDLVHEISRSVPSGAGRGGRLSFSDAELDHIFVDGCRYLAERGLAEPGDLEVIEAHGSLPGADPGAVSARARHRGQDQMGTLGSGNHFSRSAGGGRGLRAARGGGPGSRAGAGHGPDPHRVPRVGSSGVHRLRPPHG
jgi:tRNA-splicing ligase RtcB